jgi:hypothetical protein
LKSNDGAGNVGYRMVLPKMQSRFIALKARDGAESLAPLGMTMIVFISLRKMSSAL